MLRRLYNRVYLFVYWRGGYRVLDSPRCFVFRHRWRTGSLREQARCRHCGTIRYNWYYEQIKGDS